MKKVEITVAENMSDEVYAMLSAGVREKFPDEEITVIKRVHPDLIGGFTVEINGDVFDYSISSQLNEMKKYMIG